MIRVFYKHAHASAISEVLHSWEDEHIDAIDLPEATDLGIIAFQLDAKDKEGMQICQRSG